MKAYITAVSSISPQAPDFYSTLRADKADNSKGYISCQEPDYKKYIKALQLRRMNRLSKMAIYTSKEALSCIDSDPDAIICGTGMGCLAYTEEFLSGMIKNKEEFLNPSYFISSTHNTISSQVAIHLKCKSYNSTTSHKSFSVENSLLEAILILSEGQAEHVLVITADEMIPAYQDILSRFDAVSKTKPKVNGEGVTAVLLSKEKNEHTLAEMSAVKTIFLPEGSNEASKMFARDITEKADVILTGNVSDTKLPLISENDIADAQLYNYKELCGDYHTAQGFAVGLGAHIIHKNKMPDNAGLSEDITCDTILIYNTYKNKEFSCIRLERCT
jgi:hypothetical protein